jgi:hypothetical protein
MASVSHPGSQSDTSVVPSGTVLTILPELSRRPEDQSGQGIDIAFSGVSQRNPLRVIGMRLSGKCEQFREATVLRPKMCQPQDIYHDGLMDGYVIKKVKSVTNALCGDLGISSERLKRRRFDWGCRDHFLFE